MLRLLSEKGIPRLRRKAGDLKFKGKGHEVCNVNIGRQQVLGRANHETYLFQFSDAARLLSFYQLWLDDLFPKARFIDALSMVEKAGHKKFLQAKRVEWINEGKPRASRAEEDDLFGGNNGGVEDEQREATMFPARVAPIFKNRGSERPKTPAEADIPDEDEDLYGATPKAANAALRARTRNMGLGLEDDDDDDLDAFMAEEEAQRTSSTSLFGNGGGGTSAPARTSMPEDDDDLDALMAEAETSGSLPVRQAPKNNPQRADAEEDDLDAMMAESEAQGPAGADNARKPVAGSTVADGADADEEAAMAEMDGLW